MFLHGCWSAEYISPLESSKSLDCVHQSGGPVPLRQTPFGLENSNKLNVVPPLDQPLRSPLHFILCDRCQNKDHFKVDQIIRLIFNISTSKTGPKLLSKVYRE